MLEVNNVQGSYLEYKGLPLVREGNELYYGDMKDKYILFMMIMSEAKVEGTSLTAPNKVMIQVLETADMKNVWRQKVTGSLDEALELGAAWLERANRA